MRQVSCFDFDGTISKRDTLGPFLQQVSGKVAFYRTMAIHSPRMAGVLLKLVDRDAEKERLVTALLAGKEATAIRTAGEHYAAELWSGDKLRTEMIERIAWHRGQGHEVVVVSASLDAYLHPLAPRLGVDHVLCTELGVGPDGRLTGELVGGNVRGPEKVRRLRDWLGADDVELWAYGDSAGDRELLALADHAHLVGRDRF